MVGSHRVNNKGADQFARMQCMLQCQFLCFGTNTAFINPMREWEQGRHNQTCTYIQSFQTFALCIQNIETWVNTQAEI